MIALLQRVESAAVHINQKMYNNINKGLVIFLGIHENDTINDIQYLIDKIFHLRIFNNTNEKMHFSITDINGDILVYLCIPSDNISFSFIISYSYVYFFLIFSYVYE